MDKFQKSIVYVAGAYTGNEMVNTMKAVVAGDAVLALDAIPFLPHLFHFWEKISPKSYDRWMEIDSYFLNKCDILWKISESKGANIEEKMARELGIVVVYTEEELKQAIANIKKENEISCQ